MGRGAVVVILSDGWDRGEPEVLSAEMARLRRTAHRLVWLNPLAADPAYAPLTQGMHAALPHADDFLPGNSLRSLAALADLMETHRVRALVLAAGRARRFGSPKQLALIDGRPLLAHVLETAAPYDPLVVLGAHADEVRRGVDVGDFIVNDHWAQGQSSSLRIGIAALEPVDRVLVLLGDMPFITREVIEAVLEPGATARATYDGLPGHPVVLDRTVLDRVARSARRRGRPGTARGLHRGRGRPPRRSHRHRHPRPAGDSHEDDADVRGRRPDRGGVGGAQRHRADRPCLPGANITGRDEDGNYTGEFTVKLGPTTANYRGTLKITEADEAARRATLNARGTDKRGQGGATATIINSMESIEGGGTRVTADTDFNITGRLARFGRGGMIEDISNRLLRDFANCLQAQLETPAPVAAAADGPGVAAPAAAPKPAAPVKGGVPVSLRPLGADQAAVRRRQALAEDQ